MNMISIFHTVWVEQRGGQVRGSDSYFLNFVMYEPSKHNVFLNPAKPSHSFNYRCSFKKAEVLFLLCLNISSLVGLLRSLSRSYVGVWCQDQRIVRWSYPASVYTLWCLSVRYLLHLKQTVSCHEAISTLSIQYGYKKQMCAHNNLKPYRENGFI